MEYEYPPLPMPMHTCAIELPIKNFGITTQVDITCEIQVGYYCADQMREYAKPLLERIHALEGAILTIASVLKEDL